MIVGNTKIIRSNNLKNGTRSCGCHRKENGKKLLTTHNLYNTRLHKIWNNMKNRCKNKNDKNYGGKGIELYKEWEDFIPFYEWAMANRLRRRANDRQNRL